MEKLERIDCRTCGGEGAMQRAHRRKFNTAAYLLGLLVGAFGAVNLLFGGVAAVGLFTAAGIEESPLAMGIGVVAFGGQLVLALACIALGIWLIGEKRVWRCERCGSEVPIGD